MKKNITAIFFLFLFIGLIFVTNRVDAARRLSPIIENGFDAYANGSIVRRGGWTNYVNGENFIIQDTTAHRGEKALYNNSLGDSVIRKYGASLSSGKQVVFVKTANRSNWGSYPDGNAQVRISHGQSFESDIFAAVSFKSDGNVAYYDPINDAYKNFATYNDNQWTKLIIEWRSSDKKARYRVSQWGWTDWQTFNNASSFTTFDNIGFAFNLPSGSGEVYFDTLQ